VAGQDAAPVLGLDLTQPVERLGERVGELRRHVLDHRGTSTSSGITSGRGCSMCCQAANGSRVDDE
jgi:hypothetical protein